MSTSNTKDTDFSTFNFFKDPETAKRYRNAEVATGPFGRELIKKSGLLAPNLDNIIILDNACGTGVVSAALHEMLPMATKARMKLTMGDFAEPMLEVAKERCKSGEWVHTEARIVDAQKTGLPDATFTHVLTSFAIMGVPDPAAALNGTILIHLPLHVFLPGFLVPLLHLLALN
ncbi:MAG: hypothetical protein Q9168_008179 [Polycauliona sp. 1 TL-2023]